MALPRTVLRPLGGYEQYSSSRHSLGLYENVITVCRYALPTTPAPLSEKQVRASVERAVAAIVRDKLPALRVGVAGEDSKKPVFVAVPSLDLRGHVEWVARAPGLPADDYDAQLLRGLERENARAWPDVEARPPWRLVVYLNAAGGWADACFAAHHALGDGKSGVIFHTHLVELLNSQAAGEEGEGDEQTETSVLQFADPPALVPSQEELVKFTISWPYFARTLWDEFGPSWLKRAPQSVAYTGPRVTLEPKLRGYLRAFHLAPAHAAALLAGCRSRGTTLTALLHGLMLVLFARRFPAGVASAFVATMPVAMRPYVPAAAAADLVDRTGLDINRSMANLVSTHAYVYGPDAVADGRAVAAADADADDEKVWRAAAAVGADLKGRLARITEDSIMGLLAWVGDWHEWWLKKEGKVRDGTWAISNIGSMPEAGEAVPSGNPPPPRWKLTRNFYTQSSLGKDSLINLNVGGIRGGALSFVVAWHEGVVEAAFADAFASDLHACLVRYGETGHFAVPNRLPE